jgi:D-aspartate ligase
VKPTPALVTDIVGVVRSLGDAGIPSIVASEYARSATFWSRHCVKSVVVPNLGEEPEKALELLLSVGASYPERPPLMTGRESDVALVSRHRDRLSERFRIRIARADFLEALNDKRTFTEFARTHDLPVPRSWAVKDSKEAVFPCLLKPPTQGDWAHEKVYAVIGRWRKGVLIENREQLDRLVDRLSAVAPGFIIQEFIPGDDRQLFDFHAYCSAQGRVDGFFLGRKIRTSPRTFGRGSYTRSWIDPEVSRVGIEALEKIGYLGPANLNLKLDPRTGRAVILEINPRFSLWCHLASRSGVNLPLAMYNDCKGLPLPKLSQSGIERRWFYLYIDWRSLSEYRKAGEWTLFSWFRSLFYPRLTFFRWDPKDPLPILGSLWQYVALRVEWRVRGLWARIGRTP